MASTTEKRKSKPSKKLEEYKIYGVKKANGKRKREDQNDGLEWKPNKKSKKKKVKEAANKIKENKITEGTIAKKKYIINKLNAFYEEMDYDDNVMKENPLEILEEFGAYCQLTAKAERGEDETFTSMGQYMRSVRAQLIERSVIQEKQCTVQDLSRTIHGAEVLFQTGRVTRAEPIFLKDMLKAKNNVQWRSEHEVCMWLACVTLFHTGLRVSNVTMGVPQARRGARAVLAEKDWCVSNDGEELEIILHWSKTNQTGKDIVKVVNRLPPEMTKYDYLDPIWVYKEWKKEWPNEKSAKGERYVFQTSEEEDISYNQLLRFIKRVFGKEYSTHSFRRGVAIMAFRVTNGERTMPMILGNWKSELQTMDIYLESKQAAKTAHEFLIKDMKNELKEIEKRKRRVIMRKKMEKEEEKQLKSKSKSTKTKRKK